VAIHLPEPLTHDHILADFTCGVPSLDEFLVKRAIPNQERGLSRTFVAADDSRRVVAYYSLAHGSILRSGIPKAMQRNTPQTIPVQILGRFAVDTHYQGFGVGRSLLQDALLRSARTAQNSAFMFVLVHPVNDEAERFWRHFGFIDSPSEEPMLLLPLEHLRSMLR